MKDYTIDNLDNGLTHQITNTNTNTGKHRVFEDIPLSVLFFIYEVDNQIHSICNKPVSLSYSLSMLESFNDEKNNDILKSCIDSCKKSSCDEVVLKFIQLNLFNDDMHRGISDGNKIEVRPYITLYNDGWHNNLTNILFEQHQLLDMKYNIDDAIIDDMIKLLNIFTSYKYIQLLNRK